MQDQLTSLIVLPDPVWKGKHTLHDHRYIASLGAEWRDQGIIDGRPEHELEGGFIVAKLTDCWQQDRYAYAFAVAPELLDLARDLVGYLEMKLDGYRRVDKLPENHVIVMTAERYATRARYLVARSRPTT